MQIPQWPASRGFLPCLWWPTSTSPWKVVKAWLTGPETRKIKWSSQRASLFRSQQVYHRTCPLHHTSTSPPAPCKRLSLCINWTSWLTIYFSDFRINSKWKVHLKRKCNEGTSFHWIFCHWLDRCLKKLAKRISSFRKKNQRCIQNLQLPVCILIQSWPFSFFFVYNQSCLGHLLLKCG